VEHAVDALETRSPACDRCGDFGSLTDVSGRRLCAECAEKALHPIVREAPTLRNVIAGVVELTRAVAPRAIGFTLLAQLPAAALDQLGMPPVVGVIARWLAYSLSGLVTMHLAHQYVHDGKARTAAAVDAAIRRYLDIFFVRLRIGFTVGFYSLLLLVPGILKSLDLKIAIPVALFQSRLSPVRASTQWMFGHRAMAFGATLLGLVPWVVVLAIAARVGVVTALTPWLVDLVVEALTAVAVFFPDAVTLVIYEKLTYLSTPRPIRPAQT
jgi:hypothetical protein